MKTILLMAVAVFVCSLSAPAQTWVQKSDYPGPAGISDNRLYFQVVDAIFVLDEMDRTLWMYDPASDSWIQKSDFPGPQRILGFTMTIGTRAFYGSGDDLSGIYMNDFWEYDPVVDTWAILDTLPARYASATSFTINNKGYLIMGKTNMVTVSDELWEFDPATGVWTQKNNIGFPLRYACSAVSDGINGYLGLGYSDNTNTWFNDMYLYDTFSDSWAALPLFPYGVRCSAVAAAGGQYIYVGLGNMGMTAYDDMYRADLTSGAWTLLPALPGSGRTSPLGFHINGVLYAGLGHHLPAASPANDLWALNVSSDLQESGATALYWWYAMSENEIAIVFSGILPERVSLYDIAGKLIIDEPDIIATETRFKLKDHGVYTVKYMSGGIDRAFKIVI
jgi:hypothetical protein